MTDFDLSNQTNVLLSLEHVTDIPESTAVSLLLSVIRASLSTGSTDSMEIDSSSSSSSLPTPIPSLRTFLAAFLRQSYTASTLRQALQKQVSATEALPVLELCDEWLGWWLKGGGSSDKSTVADETTQTTIVDPFTPKNGEDVPPSADQIVPLVQSLLDAHFVTLLLQQRYHKLLRRLSSRVNSHTAQLNDLSTLLGALSVFSRKNTELVEAEEAAKRKAAAKRNGVHEVKKYGESMERRAKAQEKHQEVGAYQVEEFYL